jgi:hypothetical protein
MSWRAHNLAERGQLLDRSFFPMSSQVTHQFVQSQHKSRILGLNLGQFDKGEMIETALGHCHRDP